MVTRSPDPVDVNTYRFPASTFTNEYSPAQAAVVITVDVVPLQAVALKLPDG